VDGNKISICEITVPQNATTVTIDNISLLVGEREPIKPMFYPTTATETKMTYTYDTAGVINIDEYGVIHWYDFLKLIFDAVNYCCYSFCGFCQRWDFSIFIFGVNAISQHSNRVNTRYAVLGYFCCIRTTCR